MSARVIMEFNDDGTITLERLPSKDAPERTTDTLSALERGQGHQIRVAGGATDDPTHLVRIIRYEDADKARTSPDGTVTSMSISWWATSLTVNDTTAGVAVEDKS